MGITCSFSLVSLGAAVLAALPLSLGAQTLPAADQALLLGTWRVNVAKSKYTPGPAPVSETRTYRLTPDGVTGTMQRRYGDGRSETIEYRADFDKEYPVSGTDAYDAVVFKRIDSHTAESVLSHAGRVFGSARRVIASDGKTMTITFRRQPEGGVAVHNVVHYDKDEQ